MKETWDEHLAWCKDRALHYAERGKLKEAVASMCSDYEKWPNTKINGSLVMLAMLYISQQDIDGVRRWITGFR